jgi:hypothetical protein
MNAKNDEHDSGTKLCGFGTAQWRSNMDRASKLFGSLTEDELELKVAPNRNRLIYLWGHLKAMNDAIPPLFGFGPRRHAELDGIFVSQPDRAVSPILSGSETEKNLEGIGCAAWAEFQKLTPSEWLQRHQAVSPEDFFREPHRNRYASLLGNGSPRLPLRPGDAREAQLNTHECEVVEGKKP